ncbi:MAG TPA: aminotransferase class IV, partial [Kofleriaceae bacterium]|nr:aminotransferase class IV [Kofleriaceae bacterium]
IDGQLVPAAEATVSIFDRGFLYGDGLFEVLRTWGRAVPDLGAHLDRLYASATALEMQMIDRATLCEQIARTIDAAGEGDHRVRITVTRGPGRLGERFGNIGAGRTIVIAEPIGVLPTEVSLALVDWPLPRRQGPAHKTLAYLDHLVARELAAAAGADEAVRLDADGDVAECGSANVFIVEHGAVLTPPLTGILPGVTRAKVLVACELFRIPTEEVSVSLEQLRRADEIFVTSAVRGVVPVTKLDGQARPAGPITARIAAYINARPAI